MLATMKSSKVALNEETLEYLSNSLVLTVEEVSKAKTMAELLKPNEKYPEVVFIGRSNVGKSSLGRFYV